MSNRAKTVAAIVLLLVMVGVVAFQMYRLSGTSGKGAAKKEAPAAPAAPAPAAETAPPAQGAEATAPAEGTLPATEAEEGPGKAAPELKLAFTNEKVDERFRQSRFFTRNALGPMRDPFIPPTTLALPREAGEKGPPFYPSGGGETPEGVAAAGETGEISLLPLPSEVLGEETHFTLIGLSSGRGGNTGLFSMGETTAGEGAGKEQAIVMAHEGWLIGNDYIFLGLKGSKAQLLNRKNNSIILLSTGETV